MNLAALKSNLKSVDTSSLVDKVEANLVELLQHSKLETQYQKK
jgi:GntR family transcriptional regulator, transcriptional repressor for pyruvate dehydrogenase complex